MKRACRFKATRTVLPHRLNAANTAVSRGILHKAQGQSKFPDLFEFGPNSAFETGQNTEF